MKGWIWGRIQSGWKAFGLPIPIDKAVEELETLASQGFIDLVVEGSSRIPGISRKPDRSKRFVLLGFSKSEFFNCLIDEKVGGSVTSLGYCGLGFWHAYLSLSSFNKEVVYGYQDRPNDPR